MGAMEGCLTDVLGLFLTAASSSAHRMLAPRQEDPPPVFIDERGDNTLLRAQD